MSEKFIPLGVSFAPIVSAFALHVYEITHSRLIKLFMAIMMYVPLVFVAFMFAQGNINAIEFGVAIFMFLGFVTYLVVFPFVTREGILNSLRPPRQLTPEEAEHERIFSTTYRDMAGDLELIPRLSEMLRHYNNTGDAMDAMVERFHEYLEERQPPHSDREPHEITDHRIAAAIAVFESRKEEYKSRMRSEGDPRRRAEWLAEELARIYADEMMKPYTDAEREAIMREATREVRSSNEAPPAMGLAAPGLPPSALEERMAGVRDAMGRRANAAARRAMAAEEEALRAAPLVVETDDGPTRRQWFSGRRRFRRVPRTN